MFELFVSHSIGSKLIFSMGQNTTQLYSLGKPIISQNYIFKCSRHCSNHLAKYILFNKVIKIPNLFQSYWNSHWCKILHTIQISDTHVWLWLTSLQSTKARPNPQSHHNQFTTILKLSCCAAYIHIHFCAHLHIHRITMRRHTFGLMVHCNAASGCDGTTDHKMMMS